MSLKGGIAPFGQLPLLEIKDGTSSKSIMLCQSVAILRYLANEFGRQKYLLNKKWLFEAFAQDYK